MRRAVETAEPIARSSGVELLIEPDLHERRIGRLCGMLYDDQAGPWAETLRRWQSGETRFATEGAESFDAVRDRVMLVWVRLAESFAGRTYLVVAHGAVIKVLLLSIDIGLTSWDSFSYPNLAVVEVRRRGVTWELPRRKAVPR